MDMRMQADAWHGSESTFYEGTIFIAVEARKKEARFDFTLEILSDQSDDAKSIFHITERGAMVFTPLSLAGTTEILYRLCRAAADLAVDNLSEGSKRGSHVVTLTIPEKQTAEILKFLHDAVVATTLLC